MSTPPTRFAFCVTPAQSGVRLDTAVAAEVSHCSRTYAATLARDGRITVDGTVRKPGYALKAGETVCGTIAPPVVADDLPEAIPLDILYEDEHLLIVNKPPGMVVHPAPGHSQGTLVNALLHHCDDLAAFKGEIRPGIVHRLDKDTSGAMVIAKTPIAHEHLARQFKMRSVRKTYLAIVRGEVKIPQGEIRLAIGRHPTARKKMSTIAAKKRSAETHYRVREVLGGATLLELDLKTGRTHQIRVHCAAIHHPVLGDAVYGGRQYAVTAPDHQESHGAKGWKAERQMLHSWRLAFIHPADGRRLVFEADLPEDMQNLLAQLRDNRNS